jgi:hypothetical protein
LVTEDPAFQFSLAGIVARRDPGVPSRLPRRILQLYLSFLTFAAVQAQLDLDLHTLCRSMKPVHQTSIV